MAVAAQAWVEDQRLQHGLQPSKLWAKPEATLLAPVAQHALLPNHSMQHDRFSNWLTAFSAGSAALALAPTVIHRLADTLGMEETSRMMRELSGKCCPIIQKKSERQGTSWLTDEHGHKVHGIAGALSITLGKIPGKLEDWLGVTDQVEQTLDRIPGLLGHTLKRDEVKLALMGGGISLMSHLTGSAAARLHPGLGMATQRGMQLFGLACILPATLPGIGHLALTSSAILGIDEVDLKKAEAHGPGAAIAALLGKSPGDCWLEEGKAASGAMAGGVMALCCALPALISAIPALIRGITSPDRNHQAEQAR